MPLLINMLSFSGVVESKYERRQLSKLLRTYQFSCSKMEVKLTTIPHVEDIHKYDYYDPYDTLRSDVIKSIGLLRHEGYKVRAEVKIQF